MELNHEQKMAFQHVVDGHNVLILGSAGTGKSFLVHKMVDTLTKQGKKVYVTATTGVASSHFTNATTIHKWSGIGDGRHSLDDLKDMIFNNRQYLDVKSRILETDLLIIDECSMMSKRFFECLNVVCQLKNPALLFGGIQLALIGDFRQLPPVPNTLYGDEGDYCFLSKIFDDVFTHKITLKQVIRQSEAVLIKAVEECAFGKISTETIDFLKGLNRPLSGEMEKERTMLFATNELVDDFNRKCIMEHPGDIYEFNSSDTGEKRHLDKITVTKVLWLKIGVPVILVRNLTDKLVNGLQGHISEITENGPVVKFAHEELPIPKVKSTVFSPLKNADVACREQYPLKLAFALTIHKSQGMTLKSVEVNCKGIFKPGQFGVALGRCRHSDGLRVVNFKPDVCIPQPVVVQQLLSNITSSPCLHDKSCCRALSPAQPQKMIVTVAEMLALDDADYDNTADNEEFDAEFDNDIEMIDDMQTQNQSIDLPEDLDIEAIVESIHSEHVITPQQYNTNRILKDINKRKLTEFVKNEYATILRFIEPQQKEVDEGKKVPANKQNEFYHKVHVYQTGVEFRMNCLSFFDECSFTEEHQHVCFRVSNAVRTYILKKQVELLTVTKRQISDRTVTNASMARIRYVGGYCVAKVHHKYVQKKKSTMYKTDSTNEALYEESVVCVDILSEMRVNEHYIQSTTSQPDSLLDTERRQTSFNRSLTNISDGLFEFFKQLTDMCLKKLTDENLSKYGDNVCEKVREELLNHSEIRQLFYDVVRENNSSSYSEDVLKLHCKMIYSKIIKLHLMVMLNQFRKDILESFKIEKKMSHRKQIQVSKAGAKCTGKAKTIIDKESEREMHSEKKRQSRKRGHEETDVQPETSTVVTPDSSNDSPQPGTSGTSQVGLAAIGHPASDISVQGTEEEIVCKVCNRLTKTIKGKEEEDWIQCDGCDGWIHRSCAGLKNYKKWQKATANGTDYYCNDCK